MLTVAVVVSAVAVATTVGTLTDAVYDWRRVVRAGIANGRRRYARAQLRREVLRLVTVALLAGFAVDAWLHLAPPQGGFGWRMAAAFIAAQGLLAINGLSDLMLGWRVRRLLAHR